VKCKDPGTSDQITAYDNAFMLALQNLRLHRLDSSYSASQQAQIYYNNLTPLVRRHMALRDPKRKDPEIRDDLDEVRQEARDVGTWMVFREEAESAMSGRAMGALGATSTVFNPADTLGRRPKRIEPHDGEVVKFSEGATPQSKAWLDQNATKYNCRHTVTIRGMHILVGPERQIKALLANKEARAAGLVERVNRKQAEGGDRGNARAGEIAKPPTSNVSASSAADLAHSDAGAPKSGPPGPPATSAKVYSYHANTMPGSNAYSGRARGLMINFHAEPRPKPSDAISHAISHADVFFDARECLSYDNDNAHVDADVFFDTREFFDDNAEIKTRANDIVSDKTCSSIRMSSLWLSAARRAARGAKTALVTLKYIATHELTGVLQPIIGDPKRLYVPRRQIQTCIMLLVFMGMICASVGVTSVAFRAHVEATSTMSTMVMPLLISVAMSDTVNVSWYNFAMNALQHALFPISPLRYSNLHPRIATKDPYYARNSHELFQNISMMGPGHCANPEREAALVCLHLNFETKHSKVGMLDSGCNNPMQVLTDDVRACVADFDTNGRITGDQVHCEFTTDASGTLGITLNAMSAAGSVFDFDFIVEKMQLVRNLSYNLFPSSFFTRRGCDVFFHGRKSLLDPNHVGTGEIRLHELKSDSRQFVGKVDLKSWNDLWFFNYSIFHPTHDVAMSASAASKLSNTIKAHVTCGHASGRRVHGAFKHANRGNDVFSDLPCVCPICAITKSETPGHRN
jgi:hypothetical protein